MEKFQERINQQIPFSLTCKIKVAISSHRFTEYLDHSKIKLTPKDDKYKTIAWATNDASPYVKQ